MMKNKFYILVGVMVLLFNMLTMPAHSKQKPEENNKISNNNLMVNSIQKARNINIFNHDFLMIYEDPSIVENVKLFIEKDLRTIYKYFQDYELVEFTKEIKIGGKKEILTKKVIPVGKNRFWPKELTDTFGGLLLKDEKMYLILPTQLSNAYFEAYSRMKNNYTEYLRLKEFIKFMNSIESQDIGKPDRYLYAPSVDLNGMDGEEFRSNFKIQYGLYTFIEPSVLKIKKGFEHSKKYFKAYEDKLIADILILNEKNELSSSSPPLIYDNEFWKFVVLDYGT